MGFQRNAYQYIYSPEVMRRLLLCFIIMLLAFDSCSKKDKVADSDNPGDAAVHYVQCMAAGQFEEYIKGMVSCDNATERYRRFQKTLFKQLVAEKLKDLDTLKSVVCVRTQTFSNKDIVNVFVKITYTNDRVETMMVPLVWNANRWRIR